MCWPKRVAGFPVVVVITALFVLLMHYMLSQTRFGQHTYVYLPEIIGASARNEQAFLARIG